MAPRLKRNMTRDDAQANEDLLKILEDNLAAPFHDEDANKLFRKLRDGCLVIRRLDTLRVTPSRRKEVQKLVDKMCNNCMRHCALMNPRR